MGQISVKSVDVKYMGAESAQGRQDVKETSEDFKKLLQGKAEDQQEAADGSVKTEEKTEEGKDTVEASDETKAAALAAAVAAMQTGQMIHGIAGAEETAPVTMQEAGVPVVAEAETAEAAAEAIPEAVVQEEEAQVEEKPAFMQEAAAQKTVEAKRPEQARKAVQPEQEQPAARGDLVRPKEAVQEGSAQKSVEPEAQTKASEQVQAADSKESADTNAAVMQEQPIQAPVNERPAEMEDAKPVYTQRMQVSEPEEIPQKLAEELLVKVSEGVRELEIQIEPAHLGKIAIKILYEAGQATVSILCSERRTLEMIGQNARELGYVMEQSLGDKTTAIVERQETDYLYQGENENDHTGRDSEQDRQREENEKEKAADAEQFLQKLRLGLTG